MKSSKHVKPALGAVVAAAAFLSLPATASHAGGGGGGGTVAGKCGQITSLTASAVQVTGSGAGATSTPLQVRGNVANCSIYLQSYWIDFDEPTNANPTCKASFSLFNALLLNSGSSQGFSTSTDITASGATGACAGVHTLRAVLRSRTDGSVLSTVTTTYSVTTK